VTEYVAVFVFVFLINLRWFHTVTNYIECRQIKFIIMLGRLLSSSWRTLVLCMQWRS